MRFLNRKWVDQGYDRFERDLHWGVYLRHLEEIAADVPHGVRLLGGLSQGVNLFASAIAATSHDQAARRFNLVLDIGGRYLDIQYIDAEPENPEVLETAQRVLTDELDLGPDGLIEHRILLDPQGEFVVRFKDIQLKLSHSDGDE